MGSRKQRTKIKNENKKAMPPRQQGARPAVPTSKKAGTAARPLYTALFMIIGIVVLSFIFTVMLNTVVTDIYSQKHPEFSGDTEALRLAVEAYINGNAVYTVLQRITTDLAGILAMMMLFGRLEKAEFPSIGFAGDLNRRTNIGMGVLFSSLAVLVAYNALTVIGYVKLTGALVFNWTQLLWAADILLMCLFEEMFFRGYISYKLKAYNKNYTIIISSVLFALYKGLPSTMFTTYLTYIMMGILLSYATVKLGSVWFSLTFRFVWTFIAGIILSIYHGAVPGIVENEGIKQSFISGNALGFENGLIAFAVLLICFIIVKKLLESKRSQKQRRLYPDGTIR